MAKIYWLSDSPTTVSGYATISTNILNGLSELGHECYYQGHNYVGQNLVPGTEFEDGRKLNFTLMGTGKAPYSQDLLMPRIRELKPDIFCVLLDTFMLYPWVLQQDFAPAKTIFYFPSDGGGGLPLHCDNVLKKFHVPVAMAKFGQQQSKDVHGIKTEYIPHAVDIKNYYPLSEEERNKARMKWGLQDKFVVGSVFRNQGRKMADRMIKAFAIFAKTHPDAVLFMHCDPFDGAATFDINQLINRYGIQNRCIFTGMQFFNGFSYKQMNEVYNVMDVFFLSTSGEGFGVPTIEAAACGVPSIVTDYTTTQELLVENGMCGVPIPIKGEITGSWNVERGIMDEDKAAEILADLHSNPEKRKEMGKVGVEKVNKFYNWDVVIPQWDKLIKGMVGE